MFAPSLVSELTMITGTGRRARIASSVASPSMLGIWMSSVITSGRTAVEDFQRLPAIAGRADHLHAGRGGDAVGDDRADHRRIVDHQDADLFSHHPKFLALWTADTSLRHEIRQLAAKIGMTGPNHTAWDYIVLSPKAGSLWKDTIGTRQPCHPTALGHLSNRFHSVPLCQYKCPSGPD